MSKRSKRAPYVTERKDGTTYSDQRIKEPFSADDAEALPTPEANTLHRKQVEREAKRQKKLRERRDDG